jgi:hypothetical protein
MKTEKDLDQYLVKQCRKHGIYCRKMVAVGQTGFPDRMLAYCGFIVFLELKRPKGVWKLSAKQILEMQRLKDAGCTVRVCDSVDRVDYWISWVMQ